MLKQLGDLVEGFAAEHSYSNREDIKRRRKKKLKEIPKKTPSGKRIRDALTIPMLRKPYYPSPQERNPIYEL